MNRTIDLKKAKLLGYGLSCCFLLIHVVMFLLFFSYKVTPMAYFNIFSIAFYLFSLLLIKQERVWLYSVLIHLEVVAHMSLAVCFVGVDGGFHMTLIGMSALAFYAEYVSVNLKSRRVSGLALSGLSMVAYLGCYIFSQLHPTGYALPHSVCFWLQIAWGVIVFGISCFFLQLFMTNTLRSERTIDVVQALTEAIDAKDTYTNGHSGRVAKYSREIAKRAGMSEKAQNEIYIMALVHDVGKIGVPDAVINKRGSLTEEEFGEIKMHTVTGERILEKIEYMPELAVGAHLHHERIDGSGYPEGLTGEHIPAAARIIAVADAYDAMSSNRSYREAMPQSRVREEIEHGLGTQFDPKYGKIMLEMIDEDTEYRLREGGGRPA